jgi:hypothetical protein
MHEIFCTDYILIFRNIFDREEVNSEYFSSLHLVHMAVCFRMLILDFIQKIDTSPVKSFTQNKPASLY